MVSQARFPVPLRLKYMSNFMHVLSIGLFMGIKLTHMLKSLQDQGLQVQSNVRGVTNHSNHYEQCPINT